MILVLVRREWTRRGCVCGGRGRGKREGKGEVIEESRRKQGRGKRDGREEKEGMGGRKE